LLLIFSAVIWVFGFVRSVERWRTALVEFESLPRWRSLELKP
jgi:hypothetical protein